jgi:acyl-CoA thioester hydrolase
MDSLGHVNNAVYLHYFEHAAWEHSYSLGLTRERYAELGGIFVMRRLEIDYLRSAVAGDKLEIATWVHEMRGARAIRNYEIARAGGTELLARATSLWAWIEASSARPRPIPAAILAIFAEVRAAQS